MILHIKKAEYLRDYIIRVSFNNGISGEVDLTDELEGEVFGPLADVELFKSFEVDPVLETIVWKNGADLAPEFLFEHIKIYS